MSSLQIGRLVIGPPAVWQEQAGDPVATLGGTVVPAPRVPPQHQVTIATISADGTTDTPAVRLSLRRRLRSLLNNTPLKLGAFLYVVYSDDPEQDGWYVPGQGTLQDLTGSIGLATGFWQAQLNPYLAGHQRTHREARQAWLKDLRGGLYARDQQGWVYSTDFSALSALPLTVVPSGAASVSDSVTGGVVTGAPLPTGRDGGQCQLIQGLADLSVLAYERPESAMGLSDVIAYDRRGAGDTPAGGPGATWEEVYGPDYPWNWQTSGQPADTPVLDNGLVRVRYDATSTPGLRVEVWTGSAYVEQGKMCFYRLGDTSGFDDTWVSSAVVEYTPERAVIRLVLSRAADSYSRETVFVTVQRGQTAVKFEIYPAPKANGSAADANLTWDPALNTGVADLNASVFKSDTQSLPAAQGTGKIVASAGTGAGTGNSGLMPATSPIGAASFSGSENFLALLRCPTAYNVVGGYQATLAVLQAGDTSSVNGLGSGYGVADNQVIVASQSGAGWVGAWLAFAPTVTDQVNEAETIRNTGSGTTSQVTDATASGGACVKDTQTSDAGHTLLKSSTSLLQAKYRVFARVKVDSGATGSFQATIGLTSGPVATSTSTSWAWVDLGDVLPTSATPLFAVDAWRSAGGAGAVYVDRVELFLVEDRSRSGAVYDGCRDTGQAALIDSRQLGTLVAR